MGPVLSLRRVGKVYGSGDRTVRALSDVSLEVGAGELVGVVGPSGSGKTTLLTMAGLVEPPSHGVIRLGTAAVVTAATPAGALAALRRRHVGFVFQKANLVGFLNAVENVQLAATVQGLPAGASRRRSEEMLCGLGLGRRLRSYPAELSGGEQQRVALARALIGNPQLLLADEPTAALDAERRDQVLRLLQRLAERYGVAVCVVTHDQRALGFFDRIVRIEDGRMLPDLPAARAVGGA